MDVFDAAAKEWEPVRPEITTGVFGKTLLEDKTKVVLTRVAPGGKFRSHRDKYGHLFYFLQGEGLVIVEGKGIVATEGVVVRVTPGEAHSYENSGKKDLILISMNVPG
jgi:quercetin dioxygenase-like cupin family protein